MREAVLDSRRDEGAVSTVERGAEALFAFLLGEKDAMVDTVPLVGIFTQKKKEADGK